MNIRTTLATLVLGLASTVAMAQTAPAAPAAAKPAAAPAKATASTAKHCNAGYTLVKGKCEKAKTQG